MKLTPTEDLCLELLAARYRTGEDLWTFDSRHKRALESLQDKGLVNVVHGIVPKTVRASLTEDGKKEGLSDSYVPPIKRRPQPDDLRPYLVWR
jgi:DNA-binding MarR family transcriptional regulator